MQKIAVNFWQLFLGLFFSLWSRLCFLKWYSPVSSWLHNIKDCDGKPAALGNKSFCQDFFFYLLLFLMLANEWEESGTKKPCCNINWRWMLWVMHFPLTEATSVDGNPSINHFSYCLSRVGSTMFVTWWFGNLTKAANGFSKIKMAVFNRKIGAGWLSDDYIQKQISYKPSLAITMAETPIADSKANIWTFLTKGWLL